MKSRMVPLAAASALMLSACATAPSGAGERQLPAEPTLVGQSVPLPKPESSHATTLMDALDSRHSVREFTDEMISQQDVSALLWAAYGVRSDGGRTAPSAGGLYALKLFVVATNVEQVQPGVYAWNPFTNELLPTLSGNLAGELQAAALDQEAVGQAPLVVVVAGSPERLAEKYGERSERYTHAEAGHATQNLLLAETVLELGAVPIGGFTDKTVQDVLALPAGELPYYLVAVGHPAE